MLKSEDISAEKIKSGIGGYKKRETEEYIDTLRNEYVTLMQENIELKDKLSVLSEGVQYYKNMEKSLQKALILAEKTTSDTMHAAEVKAVAMEKEAQSRAETLTKEAKIQADTLTKEAKIQADTLTKEAKMKADACEKEAAIKAENLIREAKQQADKTIAEKNEEVRKIHSKLMTLVQQYEQYKSQYKQLAMAQMQVLESDAYNLDAPILQTISSSLENMDLENTSLLHDSSVLEEMEQEVVEPVKTSIPPVENPEKEKKVYVDARGEVVEVHEFREVTTPGSDFVNDPWQDETEEDTTDNFYDTAKEYEGPYSFAEEETSSFDSEETVKEEDTFASEEPVEPDVSSMFQESVPSKSETSSNFEESIQPDDSFKFEESVQPDVSFKFEEPAQPDTSFRFEESAQPDTSFKFEEVVHSSHSNISAEDMKRIERMQLERLREQEEKQVAMLKSERHHTHSNVSSAVPEKKKESDPADIFRALHRNDDSKPTVTLQDLKQQQEIENSSVVLPKASEYPVSEQKTNPETSYTEAEESFHVSPSAEEGNSLDYEMDNSQNPFGSERKKVSTFKSFREFESEL